MEYGTGEATGAYTKTTTISTTQNWFGAHEGDLANMIWVKKSVEYGASTEELYFLK